MRFVYFCALRLSLQTGLRIQITWLIQHYLWGHASCFAETMAHRSSS